MAFVSLLKIFITGKDGKLWFHTFVEIKSHNCRIQTIIETKVMSFISWIGIKNFKVLHYTTRCNKTIIVWKCRHWEITINNKRISSVSTLKIFVFQQIRLLSMTTVQIPSVLTTETAYELEADYHHVNVMHYCRRFVPSYITA